MNQGEILGYITNENLRYFLDCNKSHDDDDDEN